MNDKVRIIPLGGLDEDYKDLTIVEINDEIYVIEVGSKYPDKTKPGIDFVIPNVEYLEENKHKIKAYFLTHAQDSVTAGLAFIYNKCPAPIYCSDITKIIFTNFCTHNKIDKSHFDFHIVKPSDDLFICGRKISLFQLASNASNSFGVAISTDGGNIVYLPAFVIDSNYDEGFITDVTKMAIIAREGVLALLCESVYAEIPGYANPRYKLMPKIEQAFRNAPGRIFVAMDSPNLYNFVQVVKLAKRTNRKIVSYDYQTRETLMMLGATGQITLQRGDIIPMEDINRTSAKDILVLITGFRNAFYSKISLLAFHQNDDQFLKLNENDTFILGSHIEPSHEVISTNTIDDLYRSGAHVIYLNKHEFLKMHACEEDIKTVLNYFRPKYYIPVSGQFKHLLANAKIAVNMGIGLTHMNVFILDNGMVLEFNDGKASLKSEKVRCGDTFIDGKGIGDVANSVLEDRNRFSDGAVVLAATISKSKREIVGGPDIQARGFIYVRESEGLIKEIQTIFINNIKQCLAKPVFSKSEAETNIREQASRAIRRSTFKSPMIIPIIAEIE